MEIIKDARLAGKAEKNRHLKEHGLKTSMVYLNIICHETVTDPNNACSLRVGPIRGFIFKRDMLYGCLIKDDVEIYFENKPSVYATWHPSESRRRIRVYYDEKKRGPFSKFTIGFIEKEKEPLIVSDIPSCEEAIEILNDDSFKGYILLS
jgi:hypothetical protein